MLFYIWSNLAKKSSSPKVVNFLLIFFSFGSKIMLIPIYPNLSEMKNMWNPLWSWKNCFVSEDSVTIIFSYCNLVLLFLGNYTNYFNNTVSSNSEGRDGHEANILNFQGIRDSFRSVRISNFFYFYSFWT